MLYTGGERLRWHRNIRATPLAGISAWGCPIPAHNCRVLLSVATFPSLSCSLQVKNVYECKWFKNSVLTKQLWFSTDFLNMTKEIFLSSAAVHYWPLSQVYLSFWLGATYKCALFLSSGEQFEFSAALCNLLWLGKSKGLWDWQLFVAASLDMWKSADVGG